MSIRAISELTGWDRKTMRKYVQAGGVAPEYGPRPAPPSKLDAFKPYLEERLRAGVWNARVLLRELRERNYAGGYTILTDWLRPQRSATRVVAVRRFETAPGKQAQVDWGHLGTLELAGQEQKLHGFTFTLGYSRRMVAEAALDQKLGTLLRLHEAAFQQIGGVPEEILYDRIKTVWLGTDERGELGKVGRDAYVDWQGRRYSVPWQYAGQEGWVREMMEEVEIRTGRERIAMHGKAQRKYSVLTFPPHHQGIPLGARRAEGKILIHLRQSAPEVEKRSLAAYERVANGGGR